MRRLWAALLLTVVLLPVRADDKNPYLELWRAIREALEAPEGRRYFEESVKDALIPGGVNRLRGLRGTVASVEWTDSYAIVKLSMERDTPAEVALKLFGSARKRDIERGKTVLFEGVAREFVRDPFMLTFELDDSMTFEIVREPSSKRR
jgi:hypothetical protein